MDEVLNGKVFVTLPVVLGIEIKDFHGSVSDLELWGHSQAFALLRNRTSTFDDTLVLDPIDVRFDKAQKNHEPDNRL